MAARTPHPVNKKSTILPFKAGEHLYEVSLRHMRTEGERQKSIKVVNSRIMNQRNLTIPGWNILYEFEECYKLLPIREYL